MVSFQIGYLQALLALFWPADFFSLLLFPGLPAVLFLVFLLMGKESGSGRSRFYLLLPVGILLPVLLWLLLMPLSQVGSGWRLSDGALLLTTWAGTTRLEVKELRVALEPPNSPWRPVERTNGYGTAGLSTGWFRLANGQKAVGFFYQRPLYYLVIQEGERYYVLGYPGVEELYRLLLSRGAQEGVREFMELPVPARKPWLSKGVWGIAGLGLAAAWLLFWHLGRRKKARLLEGRVLFYEYQRSPL